jgi:hypothetical protein
MSRSRAVADLDRLHPHGGDGPEGEVAEGDAAEARAGDVAAEALERDAHALLRVADGALLLKKARGPFAEGVEGAEGDEARGQRDHQLDEREPLAPPLAPSAHCALRMTVEAAT